MDAKGTDPVASIVILHSITNYIVGYGCLPLEGKGDHRRWWMRCKKPMDRVRCILKAAPYIYTSKKLPPQCHPERYPICHFALCIYFALVFLVSILSHLISLSNCCFLYSEGVSIIMLLNTLLKYVCDENPRS